MARARISAGRIAELEQVLGYAFSSHERLIRALTHTSANKRNEKGGNYERLEFLGDRVLGLCVAEMLFTEFPQAPEGELSVRLNALVSGETCARVSDELDLSRFIAAGTDVRHLTGKRMKSVRADVVESLIAAIHLDGGLDAARAFVRANWGKLVHEVDAGNRDSKTALQEWAHARHKETPRYDVVERKGPDHDPLFIVDAVIDGLKPERGEGRSKRQAEQAAAESLLLREGAWRRNGDGAIEEIDR